MKLLTFYVGKHEIRVHNHVWTGKETVYYDDMVVSSKRSVLGTCHSFEVEEGGEWVRYLVNTKLGAWGLGIDVVRNNEPLMLSY